MKISVVIPAYNEEKYIKDSLTQIQTMLKSLKLRYELIIVENGSTDKTKKILKKISSQKIKTFFLPQADLGRALKLGLEKSRGEIITIAYTDHFSYSFLKSSLTLIKDNDIIIGSKSKSFKTDKRPLTRKISTFLFNAFLKLYLGIKTSETHGLKTLKRESILPAIKLTYSSGGAFDTELVGKAEVLGLKIKEIPIEIHEVRPSRVGLWGWIKQTIPQLRKLRKTLRIIKAEKPCPICQNTLVYFMYPKDNYRIVKCSSCSLVYLDKIFPRNFFKKFYDQSYFKSVNSVKKGYSNYLKEEKNISPTFQKRLASIKKLLPPTNPTPSILDIGCATGLFLKEAQKQGLRPSGVELSEYARHIAIKRLGRGKIFDRLPDSRSKKFDVITFWDTIEHLENPKPVLEKAYSLLKPNGILAISTGDIDSTISKIQKSSWHLLNVPQHLSFFSQKSLGRLLTETGFKGISNHHEAQTVSIDYVLHRLKSMYHTPLLKPLFFFLKPFSASCLPLNFYDIMTSYHRKNRSK